VEKAVSTLRRSAYWIGSSEISKARGTRHVVKFIIFLFKLKQFVVVLQFKFVVKLEQFVDEQFEFVLQFDISALLLLRIADRYSSRR
jgi:hypothetical protein